MRLAIASVVIVGALTAVALAAPFPARAATPNSTNWASAANRLCTTENQKIRRLPRIAQPDTIAGTAQQIKETLPLAIATDAQIKSLPRPVGQRRAISLFLAGAEEELSFIRATLLPALNRGQLPASIAARFEALDSKNNAEVKKLGAPACAASPQPAG